MTSKNDITGDSITTGSKNNSQLFRDNYDNIFKKKEKDKVMKNFSTLKEGMSPEARSRAAVRTEQMSLEMDKLNEDIKKAGEALGVTNMTTEQALDTLIEHVGKVHDALVDCSIIVEEEKQYVYSVDDETFNIESEEEAIELALEEGYETYSRGVVKHIPKHHLLTADVVIDVIADNAWDAVGEMASDFPDVSAEGKEELDKFLAEWLDRYCTPWFYLVEDVVEIKIQQEQSPFNTEHVAEELPKGMLEDEL